MSAKKNQQPPEHPAITWLREQHYDRLWTTKEIATACDRPFDEVSRALLAATDAGIIDRLSPRGEMPATFCMGEVCRRKHPVYSGPELPSWFIVGAKVKVKTTPALRRSGVRVSGSTSSAADDHAWPGEVGTVERRDGNGWWDYAVVFGRGRRFVVSRIEEIENFVRVREARPADGT
jgi:hypothetical protein